MFINTLIENPVFFFRYIAILIISISLHELCHGIAAIAQGDNTPQKAGHITLNPVVHMGWQSIIFLCIAGISWGEMPINPHKFRNGRISDFLVSVAGPLCNLALGFILIGLLLSFYNSEIVSTEFLHLAARVNFTLFFLNILPIPPLDGFHILCCFFPSFKPLQNSPIGMFGLIILFLIPGFTEALVVLSELIIRSFL